MKAATKCMVVRDVMIRQFVTIAQMFSVDEDELVDTVVAVFGVLTQEEAATVLRTSQSRVAENEKSGVAKLREMAIAR